MTTSTQTRFSDDMIGDPNDLDDLIEATGRDISDISGDEEPQQQGSEAEEVQRGSENDEENKKKDDKSDPQKVKRKLAPRLNLNPQRLKGPRGLTALLKEFENFKFKGKGHEREDLERVLAKMEHWAHRLHPKLHFEDFITKAEKLCTKKKEMQVYMNRLRMGLETADEEFVREEDLVGEEDVDDPEPITAQNEALNEFDRLLDDQASSYDANIRERVQTPRTPATLPPSPAFAPITSSTLTTEQKELIARKKKEAQERRLARFRELEEEHLREATAASLATAAEENSNRVESDISAEIPIQTLPNNTVSAQDTLAEQRERAARNKQLALEKLRARRLAAQGIQQPPPDLNVSAMSELAVPLSPSGSLASPKASSSKTSSAGSPKISAHPGDEDKCHEISLEKMNTFSNNALETSHSHSASERMDEIDETQKKQSVSTPEKMGESDFCSPKGIRQNVSALVSERMDETDNVFFPEESQSRRGLPFTPEKSGETDNCFPTDNDQNNSVAVPNGVGVTDDKNKPCTPEIMDSTNNQTKPRTPKVMDETSSQDNPRLSEIMEGTDDKNKSCTPEKMDETDDFV